MQSTMLRLDALLRRRKRTVLALGALILLVALPFAARQSEDLSSGGVGVPGSQSAAVDAALERFPGAQTAQLAAERGRARRRLLVAPERVHQSIGGDDLPGVQEQDRQELALPGPGDPDRAALVPDLERSKDAELHAFAPRATVPAAVTPPLRLRHARGRGCLLPAADGGRDQEEESDMQIKRTALAAIIIAAAAALNASAMVAGGAGTKPAAQQTAEPAHDSTRFTEELALRRALAGQDPDETLALRPKRAFRARLRRRSLVLGSGWCGPLWRGVR
jgi:hypothetical protein